MATYVNDTVTTNFHLVARCAHRGRALPVPWLTLSGILP
jgi:hypothetical protein